MSCEGHETPKGHKENKTFTLIKVWLGDLFSDTAEKAGCHYGSPSCLVIAPWECDVLVLLK